MIQKTFGKFTKWNILKNLILREIDDLIIGSLGIVILMLGAVATHLKVKNPPKTMLPAVTMLSIGLIILLHTLGHDLMCEAK